MHSPEFQDHEAATPVTNSLLPVEERTGRYNKDPKANQTHGAEPDGNGQEDKAEIEQALPGGDRLDPG